MEATTIRLPILGGKKMEVSAEKIKDLQKTYPKVDVEEELRCLQAVLEDNPELVQSRSGTPPYYTNWLKSIQKRREKTGIAV